MTMYGAYTKTSLFLKTNKNFRMIFRDYKLFIIPNSINREEVLNYGWDKLIFFSAACLNIFCVFLSANMANVISQLDLYSWTYFTS